MSAYKAEDYFIDWYKTLPVVIDANVKSMRINAINKILLENDSIFWNDIIRLYNGTMVLDEENKKKFVDFFRDEDPTFPITNNENVVRLLAAITLCFKLEEPSSHLTNKICLALNNYIFFNKQIIHPEIPVKEYLERYLVKSDDRKSIENDEANIKEINGLVEMLEGGTPWAATDNLQVVKGLSYLTKSNKLLLEETNVLWWMFGESSKIKKEYFKEIGSLNMVLFAAKELCQLTTFSTGIISSKEILKKVINTSNNGEPLKNTSLSKILISLSESDKSLILNGLAEITDLTPCLFSIKKSQSITVNKDWITSFVKNEKINLEDEFSFEVLSNQFYNEFIYLKV